MADSSSNSNGGSDANGFADGSRSVTGAPSSVARGDSPAVSELTTASVATKRGHSLSDIRRKEGVTLADMALDDSEQPCSPVRRIQFTPEEEEERYERVNHKENPGADDSDEEEEEDLGAATNESAVDRGKHDEDIRRAVGVEDSWADYIASHQDEIDNEREPGRLLELLNHSSLKVSIPGAPLGWVPPLAPSDWKPNAIRVNKKEPNDTYDNSGNWSEFVFRPKFLGAGGKGDYAHHSLPTGVTPVPEVDGHRLSGGFEFFYQGWQKQVPNLRSGATHDNMWPNSRKGSLDANMLNRLGMSKKRMSEDVDGQPDALFFHQWILPIHNIDNSKVLSVANDPRKPFYANVARWSNLYACDELGILGGGYGHKFKATTPMECLQWDGSVVMDGVLGGSKGAFLRRFDTRKGNQMFSNDIAKTFTKSCWLEMKRCYKLCNNKTAIKKGHPNYEPA